MFTVPNAVLQPASKAQFHRAAEIMLTKLAEDLGHDGQDCSFDSRGSSTSTMGTITVTTPSMVAELYIDSFGPKAAPRLMYRARTGDEPARFKWLSDLEHTTSRCSLLSEMRSMTRVPSRPVLPAKEQVSVVRRLGSFFA